MLISWEDKSHRVTVWQLHSLRLKSRDRNLKLVNANGK